MTRNQTGSAAPRASPATPASPWKAQSSHSDPSADETMLHIVSSMNHEFFTLMSLKVILRSSCNCCLSLVSMLSRRLQTTVAVSPTTWVSST